MNRVYSNGPSRDFVINPFQRMIGQSRSLYLAAPYFTEGELVASAARRGKSVQLLVGLNAATSPDALAAVQNIPGLTVRYLTHRFHAKIYISDDTALIGSANLTDAGLKANREAVICLDQQADADAVDEIRQLFFDLWDSAESLTPQKLQDFRRAWNAARPTGPTPDTIIENAVGRTEPRTINVASRTRSRERIFLQTLKRQVYEEYRPAFLQGYAVA